MGKATRGDSEAMYIIGKCYLPGSHVKRDVEKAFQWNEKAVLDNYPPAWVEKGLYYKFGTGRPIDYTIAYQSFCQATNLNSKNGICYKGYM